MHRAILEDHLLQNDDGKTKRALILWGLFGLTMLVLFAEANILKQGMREYFYDGHDAFFYGRRLSLLVLGYIGMCVWQACGPIQVLANLRFHLEISPAVWFVMYGMVVGACSPIQRITGAPDVVMELCLLHCLCEEIFFRGFITRMLIDQIGDAVLAVLLSAIMYGLYHMTYCSFWVDAGWQPRLFYMGLITTFAGIPYAWMYHATRGLVAPFLCHLAIQMSMMGWSLIRLR